MRVAVEVTGADLWDVVPGDPLVCPVTAALERALPGWDVGVGLRWIVLLRRRPFDGRKPVNVPSPPAVVRFLAAWDQPDARVRRRECQPFGFEIEVLEEKPCRE